MVAYLERKNKMETKSNIIDIKPTTFNAFYDMACKKFGVKKEDIVNMDFTFIPEMPNKVLIKVNIKT